VKAAKSKAEIYSNQNAKAAIGGCQVRFLPPIDGAVEIARGARITFRKRTKQPDLTAKHAHLKAES
jgi:hypothetical protein